MASDPFDLPDETLEAILALPREVLASVVDARRRERGVGTPANLDDPGGVYKRTLDAARWERALAAARQGHPERLALMLRGSTPIPPDVRGRIADRVLLVVPKDTPGRPTGLDPEMLALERAGYARQPRGRKKAFVIDAAQVHGIDPEVMKKMLAAVAGPKK